MLLHGTSQEGVSELPSATLLRRDLAGFDSQIEHLRSKLADLYRARESVVLALKAIKYPILTLPPEITAEIFTHYVDFAFIGDFPVNEGPLVLASVCRAWRSIALGLRSIWSKLRIGNTIEGTPSSEKLLRCWLQRAGSHDLEVDTSFSDDPPTMFAALTPYSQQWTFLRFRLGLHPSSFPADVIQGRIPLLRNLDLHSDEIHPPDSPITTFMDAPFLSQVSLTSVPAAWLSLPWAQITDLSLLSLSASECIEALQQTPNLIILAVLVDACLSPSPLPVLLPLLRTLKVQQDDESDFEFLSSLTLPSLQSLEIEVHDSRTVPHLRGLIGRSECALLSLTLITVNPTTAIDIVRGTPTVTDLTVKQLAWESQDYFFSSIAHDKNLLPNLRKLSVEPCATAIAYIEMSQLLRNRTHSEVDNSNAGAEVRPGLREFRFSDPSRKLPHDTFRDKMEEQLRETLSKSDCEIYITGPRTFDIRSKEPTRKSMSYTLEDLDG